MGKEGGIPTEMVSDPPKSLRSSLLCEGRYYVWLLCGLCGLCGLCDPDSLAVDSVVGGGTPALLTP